MGTIRARSIFLLIATAGLDAQTDSRLGEFNPNLQRALQLNSEQWSRVAQERDSFQEFLFGKSQRLTQIDRELATEQLRPSPDPMALGVRHAEIATICREANDRLAAVKQNLRRVLTAEQQTRLAQLESGMSLLPPISEGQGLLFLGTEVKDALSPSPFLPASPRGWRANRAYGELLPGCPVTGQFAFAEIVQVETMDRFPNLVRHLGLSLSQVEQILGLNRRFGAELGERQVEAGALRDEIAAESERSAPDAAVLGAKAARLEEICRDSQAKETALRAAVPALLNDAQRARWQDLDRALQLLPALAEAQEINLSGRTPADAVTPPYARSRPRRRSEWSAFFSGNQPLPGCETGVAVGSFGTQGFTPAGAGSATR